MATQTILEKPSGTLNAMSQPVFVYDDGDPPAAITESDAVTAAQAAAPANFFGVVQDGLPNIERISYSSVRISINYRSSQPRNLSRHEIGVIRYDFDVVAKRKTLTFAPETAKFPGTAPSMNGLLTLSRAGNSVSEHGIIVDPPAPNMGAVGVFAIASITAAWVNTVGNLVGRVNSVLISGHAIGTIYLNRVTVQQIDDDRVKVAVKWSKQANVSGQTRGDVTGINYNGHDYVWEVQQPFTDRDNSIIGLKAIAVYVNDVWGSADLGLLGINPP